MRLVTHTCSNTEIVCALGLAGNIVGVDDHSDYPPDVVERLPRIGPDNCIDVERVAQLEPDLVITSDTIPGHSECIARLEQAGLPHLVIAPRHLDEIPENVRRIAHALGVEPAGEALAGALEAAFAPRPAVTPPLRVLVEWWPKPVIAPARESWVTQMLERVGAINPWAGVPGQSVPLSSDEVLSVDPDLIIIAWCGVPLAKYRPEVVTRRPGWGRVRAVARGQVKTVSEAYLGRPGPRLVQGMAALRELVDQTAQT